MIDPRPYQIQLEQAQASVITAKAQLALANKEEHRVSAPQTSGAVTVEQLAERVQGQAAGEAAMETANAAMQAAQLNLDSATLPHLLPAASARAEFPSVR